MCSLHCLLFPHLFCRGDPASVPLAVLLYDSHLNISFPKTSMPRFPEPVNFPHTARETYRCNEVNDSFNFCGSNEITRALTNERSRKDQSERLEDGISSHNPRLRGASRSRKRQWNGFSSKSPEGMLSCQHPDFNSLKLISDC